MKTFTINNKKNERDNMKSFTKLKDVKTVLVEDDAMIRNALSMAFKNKDCCLRVCKNAEQGLQALKEERFDIIICDFRLPDMNGLEFFKLVGNRPSHTLKILISAYGDKKLSSELSRVGVHAFIPKPFSVKQLIHILVHLIEVNQKNQRIFVQADSLAEQK
jgi:DNA-binding NtrC family response regulator